MNHKKFNLKSWNKLNVIGYDTQKITDIELVEFIIIINLLINLWVLLKYAINSIERAWRILPQQDVRNTSF